MSDGVNALRALYAALSFAEQEQVRNELFAWQPRCRRCGTPKYLGSVGCPGPGHEHRPRRPSGEDS